ncbi:MAG: hypothetical protein IT435_00585 [Phycisphaerales bacterium]|nr:hypothetical protein [Phycisphaerales bacterium]
MVFEEVNSLRIDADRDNNNWPGAGISTHQNIPGDLGTKFASIKQATEYRFAIHLHAVPVTRQITLRIADGQLNGDIDEITVFRAYEG